MGAVIIVGERNDVGSNCEGRGMSDEAVRLGQEAGVLEGRCVSELLSVLITLVTVETRGLEGRPCARSLANDEHWPINVVHCSMNRDWPINAFIGQYSGH